MLACDLTTDSEVLEVAHAVFSFEPVQLMLQEDALSSLRERVDKLKPEEARELVVSWQSMNCANASK